MIKKIWIILFFLGSLLEAKELPHIPSKHTLSICSIFKNEAKYLKEWIEYHRLIGVDHFFLYNLGSTDAYRYVLKPYIREGLVTLINWPDLSKGQNDAIATLSTHLPAYENAVKYVARGKTKWMVFVDIDEFLIPADVDSLTDLLEKYQQYPAIVLSREFFDASSQNVLPKKKLIIESFDITASPIQIPQRSVEKMIFKPDQCASLKWPHICYAFKNNQAPIILSKWELRINNYLYRNKGQLDSRRIKGKIKLDVREFEEEAKHLLESGYEIEDQERAINRFVPELQKRLGL